MIPPFHGLEICVSDFMVGTEKALRDGARVYVSQELFDLMKRAEAGEPLRQLLLSVRLVEVTPKRTRRLGAVTFFTFRYGT